MPETHTHHPNEDLLHEYLDGALSDQDRQALDTHLLECRDCAADMARLRDLFQAIEALPDITLSRDLAPAILATIRPAQVSPPALSWVAAVQVALATLVLALAGPWLMVELGREDILLRARAGLDTVNALWSAIPQTAGDLAREAIEFVQLPVALPVIQVSWLLWILPLLVVWLVGNSILLRRAGQG